MGDIRDAMDEVVGGMETDPLAAPFGGEGDHGYYWLGQNPSDDFIRRNTRGLPYDMRDCPIGNHVSGPVISGNSYWCCCDHGGQHEDIVWPIALAYNKAKGMRPFADYDPATGEERVAGYLVAKGAKVMDEIEMMDGIEEAKASRFGSAEGLLDAYGSCGLLCVTEVGSAEPWKSTWKSWYRIITSRNRAGLPTVIVSDQKPHDWAMSFEDKVGSTRAKKLSRAFDGFMS